MSRPSVRAERRAELVQAFVRVLGSHGRGGATIAALASEAGVAAGLVHHHFTSKQDLYAAAIDVLLSGFRRRSTTHEDDALSAYAIAALGLGERSDVTAARAWVGVFAEALGDPVLFAKLRRALDTEVSHVERLSKGTLSAQSAGAVVAFVVGALVFGAFAPRKTAGFAAPALLRLLHALAQRR